LLEKLGDDRRSSRCRDDDQQGIGGRHDAISNRETRAIQLEHHVAACPVEYPGLRTESGAVCGSERGAQSLTWEGCDDMIDSE
jgi:hypothetical protein